jgi:hypothetical protein
MPSDLISQLSLGSAGLIIFAVCAGFMLLRGMTRMVINTLIFGLSAWVAFRVWQWVPSLAFDWVGKSTGWITNGCAVLAFIVTYFVIRKIIKILTLPFGGSETTGAPKSCLAKVFLLLFALVPTSLISLVGSVIIHHFGSIAEVGAAADKSGSSQKSALADFTQRLKSTVEKGLPASWLSALDPLSQPTRVALAKLITTQAAPSHQPMLDPATGKPIPHAILVTDPELQALVRDGNFDALLRHPLLTKALADPKIQKLLKAPSH